MDSLRIFVVDDDVDFSDGMALILEIEGYDVARASSGDEAIRRFREEKFDVTLAVVLRFDFHELGVYLVNVD